MYRCFKCGEPGHVKAACPARTSPRTAPAAAPPASPVAARIDPPPPPPYLPADPEVARRGSAAVKAAMGWGDGSPVVDSDFRRSEGLLPKTEGQLRELALAQVAESRAGRLA